MAGWVLQNREPVLVPNVLEDERWLTIEGKAPLTRSLIAAPLIVGDDVHGVLLISDGAPNAFDESQLKLVIASAQQVAQAINNAKLYNYVLDSAERLGQLLRSEQEERSKSQAILQSIADGVIVNDTQDKVIVFNAVAEEILETRKEAVIGQDVWRLFDVFEAEGRKDALAAFEAISRSSVVAPGQTIETTLETKGKVISAYMAPVVTETQEALGVVVALRDITREVEADRAKSEFVSTVSHELRTPLTSIKGYTDLLHAAAVGSVNEQQKRFLGIIKNNADRLAALINDLLDISRIETGRIKLKIEAVDLITVIHEVADSLREQVEGKGLSLELCLPDRVDEVMGDRTRLNQIVTNLLNNSFKYTDEGWIRLSLSSLEGAVRLDVADSGIGISVQDQTKIFERFYRADTPVMDGREGAGLGLSITKELIELHGGRIWVKSELEVGSTFTVVLPTTAQELPSSVLTELPAGAKKVLVVDDERDILALLRHQLGTQGYHVITASTGGQAITRAIEEQPDLITLDVLLPDRHGFDVLRELKARSETAHIPVVILSVVQDETSGYRLGAIDYIVKPLDEQRLLDSVSRILSRNDRILIAEDTPDTAEMLIELLRKHDYEPMHAVDGYETLAIARRERPGLILLDLRMPGMDGYEALTRLQKDPETRQIPILVMSAHAVDLVQERLRLQAMGAKDFLSKPFSLDAVLEEIEKTIFDQD
jgi:PAS domain S-box-containing protein